MSYGQDYGIYTKQDDKAITSRSISGVGKGLSDHELGTTLDRTPGAIRQRRYVLKTSGRKSSR